MAVGEKRYPREFFTKKLERVCQRLDEASTRAIAHKDFFNKVVTSRVSCGATALHLGRPAVPYNPFDGEPTIKQYALLLHISRALNERQNPQQSNDYILTAHKALLYKSNRRY